MIYRESKVGGRMYSYIFSRPLYRDPVTSLHPPLICSQLARNRVHYRCQRRQSNQAKTNAHLDNWLIIESWLCGPSFWALSSISHCESPFQPPPTSSPQTIFEIIWLIGAVRSLGDLVEIKWDVRLFKVLAWPWCWFPFEQLVIFLCRRESIQHCNYLFRGQSNEHNHFLCDWRHPMPFFEYCRCCFDKPVPLLLFLTYF